MSHIDISRRQAKMMFNQSVVVLAVMMAGFAVLFVSHL
jgi:hypothetical protein